MSGTVKRKRKLERSASDTSPNGRIKLKALDFEPLVTKESGHETNENAIVDQKPHDEQPAEKVKKQVFVEESLPDGDQSELENNRAGIQADQPTVTKRESWRAPFDCVGKEDALNLCHCIETTGADGNRTWRIVGFDDWDVKYDREESMKFEPKQAKTAKDEFYFWR